jgi:hypothetical protein
MVPMSVMSFEFDPCFFPDFESSALRARFAFEAPQVSAEGICLPVCVRVCVDDTVRIMGRWGEGVRHKGRIEIAVG